MYPSNPHPVPGPLLTAIGQCAFQTMEGTWCEQSLRLASRRLSNPVQNFLSIAFLRLANTESLCLESYEDRKSMVNPSFMAQVSRQLIQGTLLPKVWDLHVQNFPVSPKIERLPSNQCGPIKAC